jgi:hypothetical protein
MWKAIMNTCIILESKQIQQYTSDIAELVKIIYTIPEE